MNIKNTENLQNVENLYGKKIGALDGDIGSVEDFYFDDATWEVRYLVVNTGSWLLGRQVLLSPQAFVKGAFGEVEEGSDTLNVNLTHKQIEESPSIDEHQPVSRQYEEEYHRYYGWPTYWGADGVGAFPVIVPPPIMENRNPEPADTNLRSMREVTGYHIRTTDSESEDRDVGSVISFMVAVDTWVVRHVVAECGHWYAGKTVFLNPENIVEISYLDSSLLLNLSHEDIRQTDDFDVAES